MTWYQRSIPMRTNPYRSVVRLIALAACLPAAGYAAGVARVDFAVGDVIAVRADGSRKALTRGAELEVGDTVDTQRGRAQLRFQDGAYMSLQPDTSFRIEEFRFAENGTGNDGVVMSLLKGGMRTVTGLIGRANRQNYRLRTAVATIGIRGTEYAVRYTHSMEVFCAGGSIAVENEAGTLVLAAGQGGLVAGPQQQPQRTAEHPFLPPTAATAAQDLPDKVDDPVNPVQEALPTPLAATVLTGTASYNMAFSNFSGRSSGTAQILGNAGTLDAAGRLVSFDDPPGNTTSGSTAIADSGNDGVIAWGRWTNGTTAGTGPNALRTLSGNDSFHYIAGIPTSDADMAALASGGVTATYSSAGGTAPTTDRGGIGTLNSGSLTARFASAQVDVDFSVSVPNASYTVSGRNLSITGSGFSGSVGASGATCTSGCTTPIDGFFAGSQAARAGLSYTVIDTAQQMKTFGTIGFTRQ
jgi:hypothetical protein